MAEKLSSKYKKKTNSNNTLIKDNEDNDALDEATPIKQQNGNYERFGNNMDKHNAIMQRSVQMSQTARQANLTIVAGMTGVGKSYNSIEEIKACVRTNPAINKKGRPVFIFDASFDEEYAKSFPTIISINHIRNIVSPQAVRILPINGDNTSMNGDEMRNVCIEIFNKAFNSTIVYDDYDKYGRGSAKTRDMSTVFMANRHRGNDLIIIHQSLRAISSIETQNAWILRLHKTVDSVDIIQDRFPNYPLIKIAELIVWEQFTLAEQLWEQKRISEQEWKKRRSYFVYVDLRRDKITTKISKDCWLRNCKKFLKLNPKYIKDFVTIYLDGDDSKVSRDAIMNKIIQKDFSRFYTPL